MLEIRPCGSFSGCANASVPSHAARGGEDVTGYQAEPWHLRYVGDALARELRAEDVTLEEFFDVPGGGYAR